MGHPNISSHTHNLVILTSGKDLLFANAGTNPGVAHSRAALGPWVGKNHTLNLVILTNGKDLLFANAGTNPDV
jgi:hypothetical protein